MSSCFNEMYLQHCIPLSPSTVYFSACPLTSSRQPELKIYPPAHTDTPRTPPDMPGQKHRPNIPDSRTCVPLCPRTLRTSGHMSPDTPDICPRTWSGHCRTHRTHRTARAQSPPCLQTSESIAGSPCLLMPRVPRRCST